MTFQFELEHENPPRPHSTTHSSLQSLKEFIAFATNDKDDPHNWSNGKKSFVVFNGVAFVRDGVIKTPIALLIWKPGYVFHYRVIYSSGSIAPVRCLF